MDQTAATLACFTIARSTEIIFLWWNFAFCGNRCKIIRDSIPNNTFIIVSQRLITGPYYSGNQHEW